MTEPASERLETANEPAAQALEPERELAAEPRAPGTDIPEPETAEELTVKESQPSETDSEEPQTVQELAAEPLASEAGAEGSDDLEELPENDPEGEEQSAALSGAALKRVLESLIFVADKPVSAKQLAHSARSTLAEVRPLLEELVSEYEPRGVQLCLVAGGYQFRSSSECAEFVQAFVAPKPLRLSRAQLETLAIVSYRQPITRPEVDEVRGVDSGSALRMLAERRLVKILGRKDEPGRPLLYGTTPTFLEFFGLESLKDLPTLKEFSELSEEHKALFESKIGESFDLAAADFAASEVQHEAEEALLAEEQALAEEQDQAEAKQQDQEAQRDEDEGSDEESDGPGADESEEDRDSLDPAREEAGEDHLDDDEGDDDDDLEDDEDDEDDEDLDDDDEDEDEED